MKKAEFPYESFKAEIDKIPIYTQLEMDAAISGRDNEWLKWAATECTLIRLGDEQGELANGVYIVIPLKRWQKRCMAWQERKQELGI